MRTAAYCRFSSDAQREASIRDQLRNVEAWCDGHGWPRPSLFRDEGISGSRNDRPGYLALMQAIEAGAFEVLLVDDYTRLSRDHIEAAQVVRLLKYRGVRLIGVSDGLDTDRDGYKLEAGLRGLMSEWYLDDLAKKTHRGLMGQALAGYRAGGLPYGYRSTSDGAGHRREIDKERARWVRHVFERYAAGESTREIAHDLNRRGVPSPRGSGWTHAALFPDVKGVGMLGNPIYVGRQVWNRTRWVKDPSTGRRRRTLRPPAEWVITEHPELRIVDQELWEAAQARAANCRHMTASRKTDQPKGSGGRGPKYLFSGLLRCGVCGGAYVVIDRYRYGCARHRDRGEAVCANGLRVPRAQVEKVLLEDVRRELLSPGAYAAFEAEARKLLRESRPDPSAARQALARARREVENILGAIKAGIVTPTTKAALLEAEARQQAANDELAAIERFEPTQMLPRAREIYRNLVACLETIDDVAGAREALRQLLDEITLVPRDGEPWAQTTSAGLAGACQITVVAGARFELATFGL